MRDERGLGDEGAALDLAELAEQDIEPKMHESFWLLLFALKRATGPERDELLAEARAAANGNSVAREILDRALAEKNPGKFSGAGA